MIYFDKIIILTVARQVSLSLAVRRSTVDSTKRDGFFFPRMRAREDSKWLGGEKNLARIVILESDTPRLAFCVALPHVFFKTLNLWLVYLMLLAVAWTSVVFGKRWLQVWYTLSQFYYKLDTCVYIKLIDSDTVNDYRLGTGYLSYISLVLMFISC